MRELVMDAADWETTDDLFLSFFQVVGAPSWHGKNFNALRDSVGTGAINQIEVPYRLVLKNYDRIHRSMKGEADYFIAVINELSSEGVPVEIRIEPSTLPVHPSELH
jgi:RNAse (barnase) inhibitor barstar